MEEKENYFTSIDLTKEEIEALDRILIFVLKEYTDGGDWDDPNDYAHLSFIKEKIDEIYADVED